MKECASFGLALVFCIATTSVASAAQVVADAEFVIDDPENPFRSSGEDTQVSDVGPVSRSVSDPIAGKASASGTADFGRLTSATEIDPDVGLDMSAFAQTYFQDALTIGGENPGATAFAVFRLHVTGLIQQPFIVSEGIAYAHANADLSASSSLEGDAVERDYLAEGFGSPVLNMVDDLLEVRVQFIVGEVVSFAATLTADAAAAQLSVADDDQTFAALFDNSAELLPVILQGVVNPVITAESGTTYAIAPEPGSIVLVTAMCLLGVGLRRRRP